MPELLTVVETPAYLTRAERLMTEAERALVIDLVALAPEAGSLIRGTGGLRKLRIPLGGTGKERRRETDLLVAFGRLPSGSALGLRQERGRQSDRGPSQEAERGGQAAAPGFRRTDMNDKDFEGLMESLDQARASARGEAVEGLRVHAERPIDIAAVRKRAGLTQAEFSRQIGVSAATLRNWEQGRRKPEGPARILLAMLARDPAIVTRTLARAA
jgi:putative transcriptional regulator